jgi:hypothetical protein
MTVSSGHIDLRSYIVELDPAVFRQNFSSSEQCLSLLAEWKWKDGFVCRKCGGENYGKGKTLYARRCTRCKTEESVTAHTIFHHCRLDLARAFEIVYLVCNTPDMPASHISEIMETRHMTCLNFKKRILECVSAQKNLVDTY